MAISIARAAADAGMPAPLYNVVDLRQPPGGSRTEWTQGRIAEHLNPDGLHSSSTNSVIYVRQSGGQLWSTSSAGSKSARPSSSPQSRVGEWPKRVRGSQMTTALLERLTNLRHRRDGNDSWRFKDATRITQPSLAPSPQPRPAPTCERYAKTPPPRRGQNWKPNGSI